MSASDSAALRNSSSQVIFPRIEVRDVGKIYTSKRQPAYEAVSGVTFSVQPGQTVSLVGPSGCGKSTVLMMAAGLEPTTTGRVLVDGNPISGPYPSMGMVFQRDYLLDWRTALGNVLIQSDLRRWTNPNYLDRARQLLEMVGLDKFGESYPRQLSGGMRQRVALCRALLHSPTILLLDEPFAALDAITRERLNTEVDEICLKLSTSTIFVTHDRAEAVFVADRVLVMGGSPARIVDSLEVPIPRPRTPEVRIDPSYLAIVSELRMRMMESPTSSASAR